ncbi:hypothetical protein HID58_029873 [Brassica napus]|uniref:Uncharacterized protein n=1 Tax=Brassica napus TaxID=3708 RepID=A0ABQ8CFB5_BRANA|nr:hypothetical protein HID58_029873 [Brassica napus]
MALSILRSCIKSRLTIGVSRQLIVMESKVTCPKRHAPGAEFLMRDVASKRRDFSSLTQPTRTRFNTLNLPVTEAFKLGSSIINLEMVDDEKNHGSMLCHMDGTTVRSNVIVSHDKYNDDNFLQVYYDETRYGERWRSHDPTDREIMCSHLIDRSIRPLFTAGFPANVMVNVCVLKTNWKHEADAELMAIIATSAALMKLNITQAGPIGVIRIGRINENIIINPTIDEQRRSDFNLLYVCTRQNTIMADLVASEISESDLATNIKLAQLEAVKCIDSQVKLRERYESDKKVKLLTSNSKNLQDTRTQSSNHSGREVALGQAHCAEIKSDVNRSDGRGSHQIRPVHCEAGYYLHALHGSSLISCGETQVLCTATIGKPGETQSVDVLPRKSFRVNYDFPPFCTNHIMDIFSRRWREIGDGMFIEKALLAVIPSQRDFPYAIHLNSKVLASDGSSSTTSVCGGSIALMDAGVPIKSHVAGVSIGLVTDDETSNGQLENYRIITDTSGLENDLGEMDFKIAGTRNGITAIQLDAKSTLLSLDVIGEAIKYGRQAHLQILDHMEQAINSPKETSYYKERRIEDDTGNDLKLSRQVLSAHRTVIFSPDPFKETFFVINMATYQHDERK